MTSSFLFPDQGQRENEGAHPHLDKGEELRHLNSNILSALRWDTVQQQVVALL